MGKQTTQAKMVYLVFGLCTDVLALTKVEMDIKFDVLYLNHRKIDEEEAAMLELRERSLIELCQLRKEEESNASPRSQSNLGLVRMFCFVKLQ